MRATVAKRLRKKVWGADGAPRLRRHYVGTGPFKGCCVADPKRREYQCLKREHGRSL
jgi:hypothetical protein